MIDFTTITDAAGWTSTARGLITTARDAAKSRDVNTMKHASSDLLDFLQKRTSDCPRAVVDAVFGAQTEVNLAIASTSVDAIDEATAQLNAFVIDIQRVSAELNQKRTLIALEPVINTLNSVTSLVNQAKSLQAKLSAANPATINLAGLQSDIGTIVAQLSNIVTDLKQVTGQS
jgi:hypothetical protein